MDPLIDGVFAVALTILALEIKVPELDHPASASELHALMHHGSVIGALLIWAARAAALRAPVPAAVLQASSETHQP